MKLAVNLSMLFTEAPLPERFQLAADAGFRVVEISFFEGQDAPGLAAAARAAGVEMLQFNAALGNPRVGERGLIGLPDRWQEFRAEFEVALDQAAILGVRQLNCLAGNRVPAQPREAQLDCLRANLVWMAPLLERAGLRANLEPLSLGLNPNYLLPRPSDMFALVRELALPCIGVQYDIYHAQMMEGNLVNTMRENLPSIGHIQIADAPDRHQPGTGEINYRFVLGALEDMGYQGYVSLEYNPLGSTLDSLGWLPRAQRVEARAADLLL